MKALIDTDVLLDVALAREPHLSHSADVLRCAEHEGEGAVAWHSLPNCAYLLKDSGRNFLERLLHIVEVAPVTTADARKALTLPIADVEDAFQAAAALAWGANVVVTRNTADYRRSPVPAVTPATFLQRLSQ